MALEKNDHDLLIELNVKQDMIHKQMLDLHTAHVASDAAAFSAVNTSVNAAHRRMDDFVKFKNQFVGAVILGSFIISAGISIISIFHKG